MPPKPAVLPVATDSLSRLLNEALSLLEPRYPALPGPDAATPLPSLLDRCEAMLARSMRQDPARLVLGFGRSPSRAGVWLLEQMPGLQLVSDAALGAGGAGQAFGPVLAPELQLEAAAAAFGALEQGSRSQGRHLILLHDARPGYDHLPAPAETLLPARLGRDRALAALVLTDHPLLCWMGLHRHEGPVGYHPARLEDYARRCLAFLDNHPDLPRLDAADILADPEDALKRLAAALRLDPSPTLEEGLDRTMLQSALTSDLMLVDADGRPATEEPLDSPAYVELCARLGHLPDRLPADTRQAGPGLAPPAPASSALASPARARTALTRPAPGKPLARIGALLPRIDRLVAADSGNQPGRRLLGAPQVVELVEDCLGHPDGFHERLDQHLTGLSPADGALLLCGCAAHYAASGQNIHGLGLLGEAAELIPGDDRPLKLLAAELYLRLKKPGEAISLLLSDAFGGPHRLAGAERAQLEAALSSLAAKQGAEHGHSLLIDRLATDPPSPLERRRVMIEIGTTRERVPGQGSTEKLAQTCAALDIDFVTVDMDARNTAMARRMFRRLGLPFRAVTAKGEDFLAAWQGPIDYCFLDAYDFDHGNHSELRQSRYESFLGSRISDAQCHQMHLDCAESLVSLLAPDGIICFDDTWTDAQGVWTAKGTTAMPFLLGHGFKVITARNRAALLVRSR